MLKLLNMGYFIGWLFSCLVIYLIIAFVRVDLNALHWDMGARIFLVVLCAITGFWAAGVASDDE